MRNQAGDGGVHFIGYAGLLDLLAPRFEGRDDTSFCDPHGRSVEVSVR
jgi:hypothetical protein